MKSVVASIVLALICFVSHGQTLKLNEFLASNTSTLQDESGDYDDYIEVFNPTSDTLNIAGYFFTDDYANPTLWQIPSTDSAATAIPPGGYMLFWADWDTLVSIYHINMKLASGGEMIGLYSADTVVVDSITFGQQTADQCMHRCENGIGAWDFGQPTPEAENLCPFSIDEQAWEQVAIYPNPVNDAIWISIPDDISADNWNYVVTDLSGKMVANGRYDARRPLDLYQLSPGFYTINLVNSEEVGLSRRFVKR